MTEICAESARPNTIMQIFADQARIILKKGCFSALEILEIYLQVNRGYKQDLTTQTETLNTEKQESLNQNESQNNKPRNTTYVYAAKLTLTQEDKINVVFIEKIMTERKTTFPSLRNQDRKKSR